MTNVQPESSAFDWLRSNWFLLVSALTVYEIVVLVVRAQRAAHGASRGVGLLLTGDNFFSAATFIAVEYFPFLVLGLSAWLVPFLLLGNGRNLSDPKRALIGVGLATLVALMLLTSPLLYLIYLVGAVLAQLAGILLAEEVTSLPRPLRRLTIKRDVRDLERGGVRRRRRSPLWIPAGLVTLLPTYVIVQTSGLWLPVESLRLANGLEVAPVYVVEVTELWTTILYVDSGQFRILPSESVAHRDFCALSESSVDPGLQAPLGLDAYPKEKPC